jgi:hypothetical protein
MSLCVDLRRGVRKIHRLQARVREAACYSTLTPLALIGIARFASGLVRIFAK